MRNEDENSKSLERNLQRSIHSLPNPPAPLATDDPSSYPDDDHGALFRRSDRQLERMAFLRRSLVAAEMASHNPHSELSNLDTWIQDCEAAAKYSTEATTGTVPSQDDHPPHDGYGYGDGDGGDDDGAVLDHTCGNGDLEDDDDDDVDDIIQEEGQQSSSESCDEEEERTGSTVTSSAENDGKGLLIRLQDMTVDDLKGYNFKVYENPGFFDQLHEDFEDRENDDDEEEKSTLTTDGIRAPPEVKINNITNSSSSSSSSRSNRGELTGKVSVIRRRTVDDSNDTKNKKYCWVVALNGLMVGATAVATAMVLVTLALRVRCHFDYDAITGGGSGPFHPPPT